MAELGSTGGNLDNILQYLLQRIEKSGIAEGGTGGGGTPDLSNYYTKTEVDKLIPDLSNYYTKTEVDKLIPDLTDYATQAWVTAQDYVNETIFRTFKSGYDNLAAAVSTANSYTDGKIAKLNISQYATKQALTDAINGADTTAQDYATQAYNNAVDYANGKFVTKAVNWEVIDGIKVLNGKYTFFKTLYIEPETSYGAYIGWQNGPAAMNILTNGRIKFRQGIQDNIELYGAKDAQSNNILPFFGFHFNDTVTDFSSRIIESAQGVLEIQDSTKLSGTLKIGNAYLTYDSDNNALFVKGKDGAPVNLVATGDVAAYSGLGSGFDTLTDLTLTNKLTVKDIQASNKITAKSIDAQYLSVSNSMQQSIDMGECDIDNCQNFTCQYMFADEINLGLDQITELSASGSYMYITINGTRYRISATKV